MKKLFCFALSLVMLLGLIACDNETAQTPNKTETTEDKPVGTSVTQTENKTEIAAPAEEVKREYLSVHAATGPATSVVYAVVTNVASIWEDTIPEYTLIPDVTTGSTESMNLIMNGDVVIASGQNDVTYSLYTGTREYEGKGTEGKINFLCGGYYTVHHMICAKGIEANDLRDLKGKRVGVASGVMANFYWPLYLKAFGLTEQDFKSVTVMSFNDIKAGLEDGILDFGIHSLSVPTSTVSDLVLNAGVKILSIPDDVRAQMIQENPYFCEYTITADKYETGYDINTIAIVNGFNCSPDADEQMIYDFVKTLFEHHDDIALVHPNAKNFGNPETALLGQIIPIHPGAERYFREIGLITN